MRSHRVVAIVPAAGSGRRLGARDKKPFVLLGGKPLVSYALKTLDNSEFIDAIIVASHRSCVKRVWAIAKRFGIQKLFDVVIGGETRFESVRNCMAKIGPQFNIVVIHDAARPFIDKQTIERSIRTAGKFGACVVAVPENDTVKLVDARQSRVKRTLDRTVLYRAQTPQAFRYDIIKKAYARKLANAATDDASLVETMGHRVRIVKGSYKNLKITTKDDLKIAEALL